ncbi:MAG: T9SS type A sorting domain-containing protein, partial [Bacteroidota bacterium]
IDFDRPNRVVKLSLVPGLIPGDTYEVTVRATSGGLVGDFGNSCEFTIESAMGLVQLQDNDYSLETEKDVHMLIFPNPSNGSSVQVSLTNIESEKQLNLEVFDMQGKVLISEIVQSSSLSYQLELQNLSKGMYILQARSGENVLSSEKLIVD